MVDKFNLLSLLEVSKICLRVFINSEEALQKTSY